VDGVAVGLVVPWRDAGAFGGSAPFDADDYKGGPGEDRPRARFRVVSPRFFDVLGVPIIAGRDFTDQDRADGEPVTIVSQSLARRLFPNGDALNRHVWWTDPLMVSYGLGKPGRIVGIVADIDDQHVVPSAASIIYQPVRQVGIAGRLFVHAGGDPHALVPAVTRTIRGISPDQPVERAATLEDVRTEVLSPQRVNAFVSSGFAGIALLIAVVGVAGVLAFSVSARTREFGVRLAVGCSPRHLLTQVLSEGVQIATVGVGMGAVGGYALARAAGMFLPAVQMPGAVPVVGAAVVLIGAAVMASLMPAARASRVDVLQALRSE
jgi:hypothetical protein